MPNIKETTLHYLGGTSDKIYKAWIESTQEDNQTHFLVNFAFGRRGSRLQVGTKTSIPTSQTNANQIYEKLVNSKIAKGYDIIDCKNSENEEVKSSYRMPTMLTNPTPPNNEYLPVLLNSVDKETIDKLTKDKDWVFQEKLDGKRMIVCVKNNKSTAYNKRGLEIGACASILEEAEIIAQGNELILDGECIGDSYHVFDILSYKGCLKNSSYSRRLEILEKIFSRFAGVSIQSVQTSKSTKEKSSLFETLKASGKEGIVAKNIGAIYTPGRPNSKGNYLKHKFVKTASAIVSGHNQKHSVNLCLVDQKTGKKIPIGNVTIPQNETLPNIDSIVEVKYLYAMPNSNSLYQPSFLSKRDDIDSCECLMSQLEYKPN
jgi:bifunctional non-homologous end joining protein LigD